MKLKVFAGLTFEKGKQLRTIVAASSQKQAAALVGESLSSFRTWWTDTGNDIECQTALSKPGTVFKASTIMGFDFTEYPPCKPS